MKLFEYVVWKDEKRDKDDEVVDEAKVLVEPDTMLADNDKIVGMMAARLIPENELENLDRITVVIRPFG
jgi:hypothetical protein